MQIPTKSLFCYYLLLTVTCGHASSTLVEAKEAITVEKDSGGLWWFKTAESEFVSAGVTCVNPDSAWLSPQGRYNGSKEIWGQETEKRLHGWGFNTLGAWTYNTNILPNMYRTISLGLDSVHPDWFSTEFEAAVDAKCKASCDPSSDRTLGYFLGNEISWGTYVDHWPVFWREREEVFLIRYLRFSDNDSQGKKLALSFLRKRYGGDISKLNMAWHIRASSFENISEHTSAMLLPSSSRRRDEKDFAVICARKFFNTATSAVRRYDPGRLILGVRYSFWEMPDEIIKVEGQYSDVISYNGYAWWPGFDVKRVIMRASKLAGDKPVLVSEFAFRAFQNQSKNPNTKGAGWPVLTQASRAKHLRKYLESLAQLPVVVGYHWFQWEDEPAKGRFDGENSNFGLVDTSDRNYDLVTNVFSEYNRRFSEMRRSSAPGSRTNADDRVPTLI